MENKFNEKMEWMDEKYSERKERMEKKLEEKLDWLEQMIQEDLEEDEDYEDSEDDEDDDWDEDEDDWDEDWSKKEGKEEWTKERRIRRTGPRRICEPQKQHIKLKWLKRDLISSCQLEVFLESLRAMRPFWPQRKELSFRLHQTQPQDTNGLLIPQAAQKA